MNDVAWYYQPLIWVAVIVVLGAAYIQVYKGGIINFVRAKLGMPPKPEGPAVSRPKDGGTNDGMK